jgi:GNAT superfamily N-acetyltransferase
MNADQILALYDKEQRREVEYFDVRRQVTPHVVRLVSLWEKEDTGGAVIYSRLNEANVEDVIHAEIAYFESIGHDFEWKVYDHDTPADLKERLLAHGFEAEEPEAIVALDLQEAPPVLLAPVTADVRRITDPDGLGDVKNIEEQVWGEDFTNLAQRLTRHLRDDPEHLSVYVGYVDGVPASAAWIVFHDRGQFASLWGGSTLAEHRGRGLYTALVAVRSQEALRRGVRFLTVDASPMSRPILEKYGFQLLTYAHACKWRVQRPPEPA